MATNGKCVDCGYTSTTIGDLKPYLIDRQLKKEVYTSGNENYKVVCSNCWVKTDDMDTYLYGSMKIPIPKLTWESPLKEVKQEQPNISYNIVINNDYSNHSYIPTTNNINTTTTHNYSIKDPNQDLDNILFSLDKKLEIAKNKQIRIQEIDKKNQEDIERCRLRQEEFEREERRKQELYDKKLKLEADERKRNNRNKFQEKQDAITRIFEEFGSDVKEPCFNERNIYKVIPVECNKCHNLKAYPYQFVNKYNKLNDEKDICAECIEKKSLQTESSHYRHFKTCSCGLYYYCPKQSYQEEHESTERHKKALGRNKFINGVKYSVKQLRQICNANLNEDGSLKVAGFSRMSKEQILDKLLKIDNLIIPEFN